MSLRHHLLSIAGIFLGLGLGILIGASVTSDQSLLARQQAMIDRLDADFAALSAERGALVKELDAYRRYAEESLAHVVGSSLAGQRVALVAMGTASASVASVTNSCETAGGAIGAVIKCDMAALDGLSPEDWKAVGRAIADGDTETLRLLAADTGAPFGVDSRAAGGFSAVLVLAPAADASQAVAAAVRAISDEAKHAAIPVVLGWTGSAPAATGKDWGLGGTCVQVAGVGSAPGNAAAVLALAGIKGDYGRAPATPFLPPASSVPRLAVGGTH